MKALLRQRFDPAALWRNPGLRLLMLAAAVAVAAMTTVGLFADRVDRSLNRQGAALIAADLAVEQGRAIPQAWIDQAHALGLRTSRIVRFPSVIVSGEQLILTQVKAVDEHYPLRGELVVNTPQGVVRRGPEIGAAFIAPSLQARIGTQSGHDALPLGKVRVTAAGVIETEPDRGGNLFQLAPRLMTHRADAEASGLLGPTARARYRLLAAGEEGAIAQYRAWLTTVLPPQTRIIGIENARPEFSAAVERGRRFLSLAALCATLLAGVAILLATRRHVALALDGVAVMRTLGFRGGQVLALYACELLAAALYASLLGLALGFAAQAALVGLAAPWFAEELPAPGVRPLLMGLVFGLVLVLGFSLPSLLAIRKTPPLRVLRRELDPPNASTGLVWLIALTCFVGLLFWQVRDAQLAGIMSLGLAALFALLALLALGLLWALRGVAKRGDLGIGLGLGLNTLLRQPLLTLLQMTGFGFALMVLLLLGLVRVDLLDAWQRSLPEDAPNHFVLNIQPDERPRFAQWLRDREVAHSGLYPTTRARLVRINGRKVKPERFAASRARRLAAREYSLGFATRMQTDNRIVAGAWRNAESSAEPGFSLEVGLAEELGIRLGDRLVFDIAGLERTGPVTSLRTVAWDSFNVNFFVAAAPGLMRGLPVTYLTSIHIADGEEALAPAIARDYPAVSVLDLRPLLAQVRTVIEQGATAIESVFLFTLLAAALVTPAAIQVTRDQRARELAVLRTLGASRRTIRAAVLTEFGVMGLLAGAVAALLAGVIQYTLAEFLFNIDGRIDPMIAVIGCVGGGVGVALLGLAATSGLLRTPPIQVLKGV